MIDNLKNISLNNYSDFFSFSNSISNGDIKRSYTSGFISRKEILKKENSLSREWKENDLILDLYEVIKFLGKGTFGRIYKILHRIRNEEMIVKFFPSIFLENDKYKEIFISKCKKWYEAGLHPNIATCYYLRELSGLPCIFMEYIEGEKLSNKIKDGKIKDREEILNIAIQCLSGLSFAHSRGLLHKNLKPGNCFLNNCGEVKISDFAIPSEPGIFTQQELTLPGKDIMEDTMILEGGIIGTPAYMAPELWDKNFGEGGPWTDIYSLGIMLFELFCGKNPFDEAKDDCEELKFCHQEVEPEDPSEVNSEIPESISEFILKCIQKGPEDRFQNCLEAMEELLQVYEILFGFPYTGHSLKEEELTLAGLNSRALSLVDLGLIDDAIELWDKGLDLDRNNIYLNFNKGLVKWHSGKIDDTGLLNEFQSILVDIPEDWRIYYCMGNIHMERDDIKSAIESFEKVVEYSPDNEHIRILIKKLRECLSEFTCCIKTIDTGSTLTQVYSMSDDKRRALVNYYELKKLEISSGEWVEICEGSSVTAGDVNFDGTMALTGHTNGMLKLWDMEGGEHLKTFFILPKDNIMAVALSPDGCKALSGGSRQYICLWDVLTKKCITKLPGHMSDIIALQFSLDGKSFFSASNDGMVKVWDVSSTECIKSITIKKKFDGICFSGDGKKTAVFDNSAMIAGDDKGNPEIHIWDIDKGECIKSFQYHKKEKISSMDLNDDGTWLLAGDLCKDIKLYDSYTGQCMRTLEGHDMGIVSLHLNKDTTMALSCDFRGKINIWSINTAGFDFSFGPALSRLKPVRSVMEKKIDRNFSIIQKAIEEKQWHKALQLLRETGEQTGYDMTPKFLKFWRDIYSYSRKTSLKSAKLIRIFEGHEDQITSVRMSNNGEWAVSGSRDGTIRVWDILTGKALKVLEDEPVGVNSLCISNDSRYILAGYGDSTLRFWEIDTEKCLKTIKNTDGEIFSVYLSSDNLWAVAGFYNKIKIWHIDTGYCIRTIEEHRGKILSVRLNYDGRYMISGSFPYLIKAGEFSGEKSVKIWDMAKGICIRTLEGTSEGIMSLDLSSNERWILTGDGDKTIKLWDFSTGKCIKTFGETSKASFESLLSNDCNLVASVCGFTLNIWDVSSGKCVATLTHHTKVVRSVHFSKDGMFVLTGSGDKTLNLWMLDREFDFPSPCDWDGEAIPYLESFIIRQTPYKSISVEDRFSSSEKIIDSLTRSGKPEWKYEDFTELLERLSAGGYGWLKPDGIKKKLDELLPLYFTTEDSSVKEKVETEVKEVSPEKIEVDQDFYNELIHAIGEALKGKYWRKAIAILSEIYDMSGYKLTGESINVLNNLYVICKKTGVNSIKSINTFEGHEAAVTSVALSRDGKFGASADEKGMINVWDVSSGNLIKTLQHGGYEILSINISKDNKNLIYGDASGNVKLLDMATGKILKNFEGHRGAVYSTVISYDDRRVLSGGEDKTMRFWDINSGRLIRSFEHNESIGAVNLSRDSQKAFSGTFDGTLNVWDVPSGKYAKTMEGHVDCITSIFIGSDGQIVLTGSRDSTLKLWSFSSASCIWTFEGTKGDIEAAAMTGDCRWAISVSSKGSCGEEGENTIRIWNTSTGECVKNLEGHKNFMNSLALSSTGAILATGSQDKKVKLWEIQWTLAEPKTLEWDEGVLPYIEDFIICHTPFGGEMVAHRSPSEEEIAKTLSRTGNPQWTEEDFQELLNSLGLAGYSGIKPESVRAELLKRAPEKKGDEPEGEASLVSRLFGFLKK